ncbi:helix-turn-helix transcriptional regulator [Nocardioides koreensis]
MTRAASRLVGRDAELGRLGHAAERARSGERTVVVIEGDAGLGKSRLVAEALAVHHHPADVVGLGYGIELTGGQIPYGVAADLLRTLVRDAGADRVRSAAGAYAPALAPLCPDLGPEADAEATAARILPAYASTIEWLGVERLVWLVIDDLPWVDAASRDLIGYLARVVRSSRLLVVVTVRTHDPASDPAVTELVDSVTALDGVDRIPLNVLGREDTAALVTDLTSGTATQEQVERLVAAGQGSPLLTEQLVAAGLDDHGLGLVVSPMLARIQRLDPDTLRLVQLAALGDGHLAHRLLRLVYAAPEARFDAAVDHALDVGLLRYRTEEREFTFAHPLLRAAAEETLSPAERLRGHHGWGEVLCDPRHHHDEARLLVAAAHHWAATDDDTASFRAALTAARVTNRMGDGAGTGNLLLRAWNLWERVPDAAVVAGRGRDDLLVDLADALQSADRLAECAPIFEGELDRTRGDPTAPPLRRLYLAMAAGDIRDVLGDTADPGLYAAALPSATALLAEPPAPLLSRGLNALAWYVRWSDPALSYRLFARALEVSREVGGSAEISFNSGLVAYQLASRGRHDEALAVCDSGLESCVGLVDYLGLEDVRGNVLALSGKLQAGVAQLERALARLPDPSLAPAEWVQSALRTAEWLTSTGNWARAESLLRTCAELNVDEWLTRTFVAADTSVFACHRGELDRAARLADAAWESLGPSEQSQWAVVRYAVRRCRALVAASRRDHDEAHRLLAPLLSHPGIETDAMLWGAAELAARVEGDRADLGAPPARDSLALVTAALEALPSDGPFLTALQRQARADLARAEHTDTADTWAEVRHTWLDLGHIPSTGWACFRLAGAHVRAGDRHSAEAPLGEAWQIAERLGAAPLRDAVVDLARGARIPLARPPDSTRPTSGPLARLTERELEVLRHVAAGRSNDEIAEALFISPKTASVHVSRILVKLDVTTRTKAAAFAYKAGLVTLPSGDMSPS